MVRALILLLFALVLGACATLNEGECRAADWQEIGFNDGTNGKDNGFFGRHVKACEKHGVSPDYTRWSVGRDQGLRIFCVPERAYRVGRGGGAFPAVCTPAETVAMRPAWDWGRSYHALEDEIRAIEGDIRSRNSELSNIGDPKDPLFDLYALYNFEDSRRIRRLERRQRRYAQWPPRY